jgi:8-oxo-dGTP pyrophosphatase MutT (NUDIX family)
MRAPHLFDDTLKTHIFQNLSAFPQTTIDDPAARQAGVALVVAEADDTGHACLLLTRRQRGLRRHSGQYALPGGRLDEGETFEDAALRELSEELGLTYDSERVLGALDDYKTRSGFIIRPFVVWGGALQAMKPDPEEVAIVFQIPLSDLESPKIPELTPGEHDHAPVLGTPIATLQHVIHAPTAALIYQFREVALFGNATRVGHFGEPEFAWK